MIHCFHAHYSLYEIRYKSINQINSQRLNFIRIQKIQRNTPKNFRNSTPKECSIWPNIIIDREIYQHIDCVRNLQNLKQKNVSRVHLAISLHNCCDINHCCRKKGQSNIGLEINPTSNHDNDRKTESLDILLRYCFIKPWNVQCPSVLNSEIAPE